MKIHFKISYFTNWGQRILVSGNIPELGNDDFTKALPLNFQYKEDWIGDLEIENQNISCFQYKYILFDENTGLYVEEWDAHRQIELNKNAEHFFCFDEWNSPAALENVFLTSPFVNVLLSECHVVDYKRSSKKYTHCFKVRISIISENQVVCLVGDGKALHNWATQSPVLLKKQPDGYWQTELNLTDETGEIHYKYGVFDIAENVFCEFESGADRVTPVIHGFHTIVCMNDGFARFQTPHWKGAGVGVPVFSLRSANSFGVGDFGDLLLLVDWAHKVGLKLIQVLPLNDTVGTHTDADVLPYAAISAFALNPLFLNLKEMGSLPEDHPLQKEYLKKQPQLNAEKLVPFLDAINFKVLYAKTLFSFHKKEFLADSNVIEFLNKNEYWLKSYAAYCVLRDRFGTSDYRKWEQFAVYNERMIDEMVSEKSEYYNEICVNYFIQYHLHVQLKKATDYAHSKSIILKGDIPIGVNRNSVDTWANSAYFCMDMQAGAPPDMFAVKGQNWELPTYNWDAIKTSGFEWWKKRFAQMSNYFDTFRIDHILGFFRIWEIPLNQVEGIMGHLYPSIPVNIDEFGWKNVWFDYNRFCKPYITDAVLWDIFGDDMHWVKTNCLQIEDGWVLRLKPEYLSQQSVENMYLNGDISEKLKWGLFDLISNVLFIEAEGSHGTQFYPRYGMEGLRSFHDLDDYTKSKLREIYVDYFYRRQDAFWYRSGMEKLPALKRSTNMLICGEDLGMMAHCVTSVMNELGILSLEVQRAPKSDKTEFFHPADAPYLSVVTPSTHDMSTVRAWWEEDRGVTQRFYNQQLGHWGEAPYFCEWWICRDILLQHLYSPAMWAIFQIQDLLGISNDLRRENPQDERINVPSNSKFSWRYRLHINLEDLLANDTYNNELRNYIIQSGR